MERNDNNSGNLLNGLSIKEFSSFVHKVLLNNSIYPFDERANSVVGNNIMFACVPSITCNGKDADSINNTFLEIYKECSGVSYYFDNQLFIKAKTDNESIKTLQTFVATIFATDSNPILYVNLKFDGNQATVNYMCKFLSKNNKTRKQA